MSLPVKVWVAFLAGMNIVPSLVFIYRTEAQVVLGTMVVAAVTMGVLTGRYGFTRMLGLGHFYWFPMLVWLLLRLPDIEMSKSFGLWLSALVVVNGISLFLDVKDVIRYAKGERQELVANL